MTDEPRKCRVCGCTDDRACPGGCSWVEHDLCSECAAGFDVFFDLPVDADLPTRLQALIAECQQAIIDGESWADNRPEEPPIDIGSFRVLKANLERALEAFKSDDLAACQRFLRKEDDHERS